MTYLTEGFLKEDTSLVLKRSSSGYHAQEQSPLFCLSRELRDLIYGYVLTTSSLRPIPATSEDCSLRDEYWVIRRPQNILQYEIQNTCHRLNSEIKDYIKDKKMVTITLKKDPSVLEYELLRSCRYLTLHWYDPGLDRPWDRYHPTPKFFAAYDTTLESIMKDRPALKIFILRIESSPLNCLYGPDQIDWFQVRRYRSVAEWTLGLLERILHILKLANVKATKKAQVECKGSHRLAGYGDFISKKYCEVVEAFENEAKM